MYSCCDCSALDIVAAQPDGSDLGVPLGREPMVYVKRRKLQTFGTAEEQNNTNKSSNQPKRPSIDTCQFVCELCTTHRPSTGHHRKSSPGAKSHQTHRYQEDSENCHTLCSPLAALLQLDMLGHHTIVAVLASGLLWFLRVPCHVPFVAMPGLCCFLHVTQVSYVHLHLHLQGHGDDHEAC